MKFYDASKELPKSSCNCVVITEGGFIMSLSYSSKYKKFNVYDWNEPERAEQSSIKVAYWKLEQEFLQEVEHV